MIKIEDESDEDRSNKLFGNTYYEEISRFRKNFSNDKITDTQDKSGKNI